jgi:hypothetical protein
MQEWAQAIQKDHAPINNVVQSSSLVGGPKCDILVLEVHSVDLYQDVQ